MSLPAGWAQVSIEEVFSLLSDGRLLHQGWSPQCEKEPSPSEEIWGVLRTTSIQSGFFLEQHNKRLPNKLSPRPVIEVAPGDILITCAGPRVRCGVACLVRSVRKKLMMSGKMYRFRVSDTNMDARYVAAYLLTSNATEEIDRMKTGGSDSGLNLTHERFRRLQIPVAPLPEQRRIVGEIEKQFTRIDDAVNALKRVQANLKRYRASVLKSACEGRLVPTEAELARKEGRNYEPASELLKRILAERRAKWEAAQLQEMIAANKAPNDDKWREKYREAAPNGSSLLPALPTGWTWSSFEQLISFGPQNGLYKPATAYGSGTPIVRIDDYQDYSFKNLEELRLLNISPAESSQYGLLAGDILVNRVNSPSHLGKAAVTSDAIKGSVFESNMMRLRLSEYVDPRYVVSYLTSIEGRQRLISNAKWAVNQASINQKDVLETPIPLPPKTEQTRIVDESDSRLSTVAHLLSELSIRVSASSKLRSSVLKSAFSGKLVPQDPNDEPASVLLKRIRAERAALAAKKESQSAKTKAETITGQRRRRVATLALGVRPGKTSKTKTSAVDATQEPHEI